MSTSNKPENYIQERLDALSEIDFKIVSLLENFSSFFETYTNKDKDQFINGTKQIFDTLSKVAIDLRKEVKHLDDNIGVYNKNKDGIMILPINVDQKNGELGKLKLNAELRELSGLLHLGEGDSETSKDNANEDLKDTQTSKEENDLPSRELPEVGEEDLQNQDIDMTD
ncbi:MED11 [Candida theae]|uniref:Mediator of RNA polymerase II transcription subunit 11 n=1 Tax=Candida theae TaxID=1198502 RepID=A0AAD5BCY2_9ASCO|nr:MED11 [Candida theae]KAI5955989.1 MED11 [Candida theae]